MKDKIPFTLSSARVNNDLKQTDVVSILKDEYGIELTRQYLSKLEIDSTDISINLAEILSEIYGMTKDDIFFGHKSTLSYTKRKAEKQEV